MDWKELIETLLYAVITTGLPILLTYSVSYLKAKRNEKLQNIENTYIKDTLIDATNIIINTVDAVSQTYVNDLKENGKFKTEEQNEALRKAINQTKELLSLDATNLIVEKYNDIDLYIRNTIESYIASTK
jgi:hypothetical protein